MFFHSAQREPLPWQNALSATFRLIQLNAWVGSRGQNLNPRVWELSAQQTFSAVCYPIWSGFEGCSKILATLVLPFLKHCPRLIRADVYKTHRMPARLGFVVWPFDRQALPYLFGTQRGAFTTVFNVFAGKKSIVTSFDNVPRRLRRGVVLATLAVAFERKSEGVTHERKRKTCILALARPTASEDSLTRSPASN